MTGNLQPDPRHPDVEHVTVRVPTRVEVDPRAIAAVRTTLLREHPSLFEVQRRTDKALAERIAATAVAAYVLWRRDNVPTGGTP